MNDQVSIIESQADKDKLRLEIEQQTQDYLNKGGKIHLLKPGQSGVPMEKIKALVVKSHYETNINTKRKTFKR